MATLALSAAGAAIGNSFGAAAVGWAIGGAIGNFLFQPDLPDITGPRLSDLKVQNSAYGNMIPLVNGVSRISGNVIWMSKIREVVTKKKEGGKGGPSQTTKTYSYFASLAISLCEGPVVGVGKIWADSKLIYNLDISTATPEAIFKSNKKMTGMKFYTGNETQLPDPTMEAHLGVGNVPGYRGQAYIVLHDFEVTEFGGRIPNFTFEIITSFDMGFVEGSPEEPIRYTTPNAYGDAPQFGSSIDMRGDGTHYLYHTSREANGGIGDMGIEFTPLCRFVRTTYEFVLGKPVGSTEQVVEFPVFSGDSLSVPGDSYIGNWSPASAINYPIQVCRGEGNWMVGGLVRGLVGPFPSALYYLDFDTGGYRRFAADWLRDNKIGHTTGELYLPSLYAAKYEEHLYVQVSSESVHSRNPCYAVQYINMNTLEQGQLIAPIDQSKYPDFDVTPNIMADADGLHLALYMATDTEITHIRIISYVLGEYEPYADTGFVEILPTLGVAVLFWRESGYWMVKVNTHLFKMTDEGVVSVVADSLPDDISPVLGGDIGAGYLQYGLSPLTTYGSSVLLNHYVTNFVGTNFVLFSSLDQGFIPYAYGLVPDSDGGTTLPELVAYLCLKADLQPGDFDVGGLQDTPITGYVIASRARARELLEVLARTYQFDAIESSTSIKFVSRGSAAVATIESGNVLLKDGHG